MPGVADLTDHTFPINLSIVQVYQDQVGARAISVRRFPANKRQRLSSGSQVHQLKVDLLPGQGSFKKEDIGCVFFNDEDGVRTSTRDQPHASSSLGPDGPLRSFFNSGTPHHSCQLVHLECQT
jgi:hypothetical protein